MRNLIARALLFPFKLFAFSHAYLTGNALLPLIWRTLQDDLEEDKNKD